MQDEKDYLGPEFAAQLAEFTSDPTFAGKFDESKHSRAKDGTFAPKGGGGKRKTPLRKQRSGGGKKRPWSKASRGKTKVSPEEQHNKEQDRSWAQKRLETDSAAAQKRANSKKMRPAKRSRSGPQSR